MQQSGSKNPDIACMHKLPQNENTCKLYTCSVHLCLLVTKLLHVSNYANSQTASQTKDTL